jgi:hypothetical protein
MRIVPGGRDYTTATLRAELIADLAALRDGKINRAEARTRGYIAKQVIDTMKLEVVAAAMNLERGIDPIALLEAA